MVKAKFRPGLITRILWIVMITSSVLMLFSITTGNLLFFNILTVLIGLFTGGIMATFLINSQNAVNGEDRTVLSGVIQLGRYFGASIGVTILTGMLPKVNLISNISEFIGAFGFLVALCITGLINEII
ncbi:hypothetical protein [Clostridium sp.]|uniref:hypothetical protein n=1 Tax=Clostridium sp. TaxID=1506 RepID=UPI002FC6B996